MDTKLPLVKPYKMKISTTKKLKTTCNNVVYIQYIHSKCQYMSHLVSRSTTDLQYKPYWKIKYGASNKDLLHFHAVITICILSV